MGLTSSRHYAMLRARLVLRLVRACAQADIASELDMDWPALCERINRDPEFRATLLRNEAIDSFLEDLP